MKTIITRTLVILLALVMGSAGFGAARPAAMAASGPDLVIDEINLSPAEPILGEETTITITVKNNGDAAADASLVTCYLDESIIDTRQITSLEPGVSATAVFTWEATQGSHTIKATADISGKVAETDETNNTATYSITTIAPDLVVQSISWLPTSVSKGDNVVFSITVKNQGNMRSAYTTMDFQIDGASRGYIEVPAIDPGATTVIKHNWIALADSHDLKAIIDINNNVKESDELDNEFTAVFDTLLPDLVMVNIAWAPENPSQDDTVSFNVTISNLGTGRSDTCDLGYYIDDVFVTTVPVPALNAGTSCNVSFNWKASLNPHDFRAVADYFMMVGESSETNNEMSVSLQAVPPDLMFSNITWLPATPAAGDSMVFTIVLKNQGSGRAELSRAIIYIDNRAFNYLDFPALPAGEEKSLTCNWTAESGSHIISVAADYWEKIKETKEDNNTISTTVKVELPDITISNITYSPLKPAIGDMVSLNITMKNLGKGKTSGFSVACYVDDDLITVDQVSPIVYGASVIAVCKWKITNGRHTFKAIVDDGNTVWETNENNNTFAITIAPNMPDLAVTNVVWSPADIPVGSEVTFTIDIANTGGMNAGASRLVYYVDGSIAGFNDIDSITAGAKITQTFTWAAAEGQHNISIVADSKDQITEIDELNNTVTIKIPPPDLVVKNVSYSGDAVTGETVTITASVMNERGSRTDSAVAECFVDNESIGTADIPPLAAGEAADITFEWAAEPGSHSFKVCVDTNKSAMETDETNNEGAVVFTTTVPDLMVEGIKWLTNNSLNSNEVDLTVVITNKGGCETGAFTMKYSFDRSADITRDIPSIPADSSYELSLTAILSEGQHTIRVTLDTEKAVSETNKDNNTGSFTFATDAPDLIIRSITWGPLTAIIGETITITAKIENIGVTGAPNARYTLSVDGVESGSTDIGEIVAGATASANFTWTALEGIHEIVILADAGQTLKESDENNNSRSRTITFLKPETPESATPALDTGATTGPGLLETYWWALLLIGGILGILMLYTTIKNMRKK